MNWMKAILLGLVAVCPLAVLITPAQAENQPALLSVLIAKKTKIIGILYWEA